MSKLSALGQFRAGIQRAIHNFTVHWVPFIYSEHVEYSTVISDVEESLLTIL